MMMADMCNADAEDLLGLILFFLRDETDFEFYIGGKLEQIKILVCASCLCKMKKYVGGCTIVFYHDAYDRNVFAHFDLNTKKCKI